MLLRSRCGYSGTLKIKEVFTMAENIIERLNRIGAERKIADFKVKQKQDYV